MIVISEYGLECDLDTHEGCVNYYGINYDSRLTSNALRANDDSDTTT